MHFLGSFFRSVDLFEMPAIAPITGMLRKHVSRSLHATPQCFLLILSGK